MADADLARIKRNVAKMAAQNAPEADIDGYIASEGVSIDDVRNFKMGPQGHSNVPEFDPGIRGYNSKTGLVEKTGFDKDMDKIGAFSIGGLEGMPIVGPSFNNVATDIATGLVTPFSDKTFAQNREKMVAAQKKALEENPKTALAGNVAGGVLGTAPMVAAAPGLFGGGGFGANIIKGIGSGAVVGGADAGVRSGGDLSEMAKGGLLGAALGGVAPLAGRAIGKGVGLLTEGFGGPRMSTAERLLGRAAIADDVADDFAGAMRRAGPDAMAMDLGPNLRQQAGALAATPGPGQKIVRGAIEQRGAKAGQRIGAAVDDALGKSVDTLAMADDIIAKRSAAAEPLYKQAYSKPVPFTRELEELITRPSVGRALKSAQKLAADEGIPSQQWFANVAEDGSVAIKNVPDMRQLDLTKRALGDMIDEAKRAGRNNEARILKQTQDRLVGMLDEAVPEYASARKAYSGPTQVKEALEDGGKAFDNAVTPAQLKRTLAVMGEAEREAYIQGARAKVADTMGTARNDALAARSVFQKGYNREKLEMLVGKNEADKLLGSLNNEANFAKTRDVVTGNSETAARAAAQKEINGEGGGILTDFLNFDYGKVKDRMIGGVGQMGRDAANEELARLLTGPESVSRKIQLLQRAQQRGDLTSDATKKAIQSLIISGGTNDRKRLELTVSKGRN